VHLPEFINHLAGIALGLISFNGFNGKNDSLSRNPSGVRTMLSAFEGGSGSLDSKATKGFDFTFFSPFLRRFSEGADGATSHLLSLSVITRHQSSECEKFCS
jgi:hypothetical protein